MRFLVHPVVLCGLCAALPGQGVVTDTLFADVNTAAPANGASSDPRPVGEHNGTVWFSAATLREGHELWSTDGSPAGTARLTDLVSGTGHSHPRGLAGTDSVLARVGKLLFSADSDQHGRELFTADLRGGGVQLLRDFDPAGDGDPEAGVLWHGEVWFLADDGVRGVELWRTDGTATGTRLGEDVTPGPVGGLSRTATLRVADGRLWWFFNPGNTAFLWVKDSPTTPARALVPLQAYQSPYSNAAEVPGGLVFTNSDAAHGTELWFSDGTAAGTLRIADLDPGTEGSSPLMLGSNGSVAFFSADTRALGRELYVTDGTAAGTRLVTELRGGASDGLSATRLALVDPGSGDLVFVGNDGRTGREVWRSDGTANGTRLLADLYPGLASSSPRFERIRGFKLYLRADLPQTGSEFYRMDLRTGSAGRLTDIQAGAAGSSPDMVGWTTVGPLLNADDGQTGREPWIVEIPSLTVRPLGDLFGGPRNLGSDPEGFFRWRDQVFFAASTPAGRSQPWVLDGTTAGARFLGSADIDPDGAAWKPLGGTRHGLLFSARPTGRGQDRYVWVTDGTPAGTLLLPQFGPRTAITEPTSSIEFGDDVLFTEHSLSDTRLWRSDGTPTGTAPVLTAPNNTTFDLRAVIPGVGVLGRGGDRVVTGSELWITDGTAAGTRLLADIRPGGLSSYPSDITPLGQGAVFAADDGVHGTELWWTDGTTAGTRLLADLEPGTGGSRPVGLQRVGDRVLFGASTTATGFEIWATDGTPNGTLLLVDSAPGTLSLRPSSLTAAGEEAAWFWSTAPGGGPGQALWRTDGTSGGTRIVATTTPSGQPLAASSLYACGDSGQVLLIQSSAALGQELWIADGVRYTLRALTDSNRGRLDADPITRNDRRGFVRLGDKLLFAATNSTHGREVHAVTFAEADGPWVASRYGRGCGLDIGSRGSPAVGSAFAVRVETGAPGAPTALLFGTAAAYERLTAGCDLHVAAPIALAQRLADPVSGSAQFSFTVPNVPALVGDLLHLQGIAAVPGGPVGGVAAGTPGLEVVLGR